MPAVDDRPQAWTLDEPTVEVLRRRLADLTVLYNKARADAFEECAKLADGKAEEWDQSPLNCESSRAAELVAAAIRARSSL